MYVPEAMLKNSIENKHYEIVEETEGHFCN